MSGGRQGVDRVANEKATVESFGAGLSVFPLEGDELGVPFLGVAGCCFDLVGALEAVDGGVLGLSLGLAASRLPLLFFFVHHVVILTQNSVLLPQYFVLPL